MACMPRTTLKYKSSAEHLSGLCIWCFLPLSSIQLTTGCWKVLSAISLSVITTLALCSDPGLSWRARGHVPFHNAASSLRGTLLFHKGWCFEVMFLLFPKQWVTRKVEQTKKKAGGSWQRFSAKFSKRVVSAFELVSRQLNSFNVKNLVLFALLVLIEISRLFFHFSLFGSLSLSVSTLA